LPTKELGIRQETYLPEKVCPTQKMCWGDTDAMQIAHVVTLNAQRSMRNEKLVMNHDANDGRLAANDEKIGSG